MERENEKSKRVHKSSNQKANNNKNNSNKKNGVNTSKKSVKNTNTKSKNQNKKSNYSKKNSINKEEKVIKKKSKNIVEKSINNELEEFVPKKKIDIRKNELEVIKLKRRNKFSKIILYIFLFALIGLLITSMVFFIKRHIREQEENKIKQEQENIKEMIKEHYNQYVIVKEDTSLYRLNENNEYYEYGIIYQGTEISLDNIDEFNHLIKYFYSKELDAYIDYNDLLPINELTIYDNRYKNYIPFNKNVVTKEKFTLYDNEKKVYTFNQSMSFPIVINNYDNRYYVEYGNRLLSILKDDVKEIVKSSNSKSSIASKITTLCYHRVYDTDEKCNDLYVCKKKSSFDKEMKYLKDNNYFTLTMQEVYWYLSKNIQIPKNSVVITMDDGHLWNSAIEVLEKYQLNGTGFIKTASFADLSNFDSPYFELGSHTNNMHTPGVCRKETEYQQGGGILCLKESTVLNDLQTSRDRLNGAIALAYPFYDYNNRAVNLVKKAGFKLAFIGSNSVGGRSWPGISLYKIPRMTMWDTTSFEQFKQYVKN